LWTATPHYAPSYAVIGQPI
ncbi:hypothetical protein THAOC_24016, partial [Thalassiosira oceanica]